MAFNLNDDKGEDVARAYMEQFDEVAQKQMRLLLQYIEVKGYEATKAEINRGLPSRTMEA